MISLEKLAEQLGLVAAAANEAISSAEVNGVYCSDLLSDVIAKALSGNALITVLTHQNVIGVAALVGLSAVIMTGGMLPEESAILAANKQGIPVFTTELSSFETAGRIHRLLYS